MTGKALAAIAAGVLALIVICSGLAAVMAGGLGGAGLCAPAGPPATPTAAATAVPVVNPSTGTRPTIGPWDADQVANANVIITTGMRMQVPPRGWVIALATAMQESGLRNLGNLGDRNDHDSLGLFQQRPSAGWGTPEQIMDPAYASAKFYDKLLAIKDWQNLPLTVAAQKVQISAFPEAYAKHETAAAELVTALTGMTGALGACGGAVGPQGWIAPVSDPVVSPFGPRGGAMHEGVDLGSPKGTPIKAAAAGTVIVAMCNAPADWGCDRDGSENIPGCGWYVEIDHGAGLSTRYCHMLTRPAVAVGHNVTAGQIIGVTGSSGNSSGPHLHLEVRISGQATDPVPFFAAHAAPLAVRR
ncbi:M23 family metallopeptidase [Longispora sp. K20-0274]|uniref:M23 family metallopeptidase n=1 Tax=Longispora sp. K20-0274 TaxID=3088255 RepID=UPI00399A7043